MLNSSANAQYSGVTPNQRPVRHGASREPAGDGLRRLDLLERDRLSAGRELEQVAQLRGRARLDELAELLVQVAPAVLDRPLQQVRSTQVGRVGLRHRLGIRPLQHDDFALVLARRRLDTRELPLVVALLLRVPAAVLAVALRCQTERVVERVHDVRVVAVVLAAALAVAEEARLVEGGVLGAERGFVAREHVCAERVEAHAADLRHRERQARLDDLRPEPDGLEDLRGAVAVDRRNPHLREDLEDTVLERGLELRLRLGRVELPELVVVGHARHGLEREARAHRIRAEAQQARDAVDVACVTRRGDDRRLLAGVLGDEPVMHRAEREEGRDRRPLGIYTAVGDHQDLGTGGDRFGGGVGQLPDGRLEAAGPVGDRERGAQADRLERRPVAVDERLHGPGIEEERGQLEQARGARRLGEQRPARPKTGAQRHDEPLAQMVDRRVGDLREPLLEVVEHGARTGGDGGERHVVPHRERRLLGVGGHRLEHHGHLLAGETERHLLAHEVLLRRRHLDRRSDVCREQPVTRPLGVRLQAGQPRLDRGVVLHGSDRLGAVPRGAVGVDADHVAGPEPAAPHRAVTGHGNRAHLGRAHDESVVAHLPAQRSQPVAVERGADTAAVAEDEPGRPVPGVGQAGVVAEEAADTAREVTLALPRFGDEHGHGMADVASAAQEQLDGGVELAGVGVVGIEHRPEQLLGAEPHLFGPELPAGDHAQLVAAHGVDLAVVAQVAEGLRSFPCRSRVGREAAVEDRERRDELVVREVGVERGEPVAEDERLVRDGDEREAGEVVADARLAARRLCLPPRPVRAPFGLDAVDALGPQQDRVPEGRLVDASRRAEVRLVDRDRTPPGDFDALGGARIVDGRLRDTHGVVVRQREERRDDADPGGVEVAPEVLAADPGEVAMRERNQDPGAVAGDAVGRDRLAVTHAREPGEGSIDDLTAGVPGRVRDEADAAGIAFGVSARREVEVGQPRSPRSRDGESLKIQQGATALSRKAQNS